MTDSKTFENISFEYRINSIGNRNFPKTFPLHWHKYVEIIGLPDNTEIKQQPVIQIQKEIYRLAPGDLLIIWPGELHQIINNSPQQIIGIQFPLTLFHDLPDFTPYLQYFKNCNYISVKLMTELSQNLMHCLKQMVLLQTAQQDFRGVETLICLYEFFIIWGKYLAKQFSVEGSSFSEATSMDKKINSICRYISDNCDSDLSLDEISSKAGFSPYYFSRKFKRLTGDTFIEYLTKQRIKRAQILLSDFSLSMTEISYHSGFKSISTFNRVFLKYKGCSPSEYRQYYHKDD